MSQHEPTSKNSPEGDPRLLLPEWLRDEPEANDSDVAAHLSSADQPTGVAASAPGEDPKVDDEVSTGAPAMLLTVKAQWQAPPPPVESFDPGTLIAPDDLPDWIRTMSSASQSESSGSEVVASEVTPGDSAFPDFTELERTLDKTVGPGDESTASPPVSDLTETRIVLLVGGTLVIILAVIARFYL